MPSFAYVARETGTGREIRSSLDAATEQAAIAALLNRNLLVVSIQEKVAKKGRTAGGSVPLSDLVMFTRQLATMVDAGSGHGAIASRIGRTDAEQGDAGLY
jgi:type IV pilus assembly protein PilC